MYELVGNNPNQSVNGCNMQAGDICRGSPKLAAFGRPTNPIFFAKKTFSQINNLGCFTDEDFNNQWNLNLYFSSWGGLTSEISSLMRKFYNQHNLNPH